MAFHLLKVFVESIVESIESIEWEVVHTYKLLQIWHQLSQFTCQGTESYILCREDRRETLGDPFALAPTFARTLRDTRLELRAHPSWLASMNVRFVV